jgi:hypothetical protein
MGVIQPPASSAPASSANGCKRKRGLWRDDVTARRFPPPWTVQELDACFIVKDSAGQKMVFVYFRGRAGTQIGGEIVHQRRGTADRDPADLDAG